MTQEEREKANIEMLPGNLSEAITAFEKDAHIQSILGSHTSEVFKTAKKKEWSCYTNQISQWEIDEYLDMVHKKLPQDKVQILKMDVTKIKHFLKKFYMEN